MNKKKRNLAACARRRVKIKSTVEKIHQRRRLLFIQNLTESPRDII